MYLGWTLMWFEAFSGLKINLSKSEIIPVGRVDNVEMLATELACGVDPSSLRTWVFPLGLLTRRWRFGILLWKDLERDWHRGKDNTSQIVGGSCSFRARCLAFLFTSTLCSGCQSLCALDWKRFRETSFGVVAT